MRHFFNWLADKLFDEKVNSIICWVMLALAGLFIAFQAIRGVGYILIASI